MFVLGKLRFTRAVQLYQLRARATGAPVRTICERKSQRTRSGAWTLIDRETGASLATVSVDATVRMEVQP